ncbi:sensor histidine kinase [Microlunatus ginsengisoli]|uniref:histidine kinase n=1 Tax=Microlunatus ginsengisoli TaxID=363863 RepID=A0ABP6ZPZ2_9ACTN
MSDYVTIVALTVGACVVVGGLGVVVLHLLRRASLRYQLVVAGLLPVAAVTATVVINVWLMFLSPHDSTVITIALITAVPLAVLASWWIMRRVAVGSARLSAAMQQLIGDSLPSDIAAAPVETPPGSPEVPAELAVVLNELDSTRQTLAEARRRQQAAEDARRELVAFMSHDLRTPLAGLRALAEGLEDGVVTDVPRALRHLRATVGRMSHLVDDLFELSRVQGARPARPETLVSLTELIMDVASESAGVARGARVRLDVDVPADDRLAVLGSADDLARALTNLVANAVRHTDPGQQVRLVGGRAADGHVRVEVIDRCGGIPAENLARVFDVGWRGNEARSGDGGAGLGLAIARGVVESHDGRIAVDNVSGGCRFAVDLPQSGPARAERAESRS